MAHQKSGSKRRSCRQEKERHRALIVAFARRFHDTVLCVDHEIAAAMDSDDIIVRALDFLRPYRTSSFKAFADAAHLSDFRRTKELVHEVTAQLDSVTAGSLAVSTCTAAVEEFPHVFPNSTLQDVTQSEFVSVVGKQAMDWLHRHELLTDVLLFVRAQHDAELLQKPMYRFLRRLTPRWQKGALSCLGL
uniref:Uncharacterized protein n=2 Tax=Oxyrrhis marina TaxID=2969 RepID=A0A7S3XGP6_OXYMA